uniref:eukaryotic translation initiation factor 5B-like n=1 Tax=Scatophagus argus TaxID=75038 RepID=UPI001ED82F29|nr:eukaryotic translation initiation factor 5B-like [Scatophagus argus]
MTKKAKMTAQIPPWNVHRKTKLCDTTEERKTCEEERERQQEESSVEERKEASVKPRFIQLRKKRPAHTPSNSLEISKKAKMAVAVQVPSQEMTKKAKMTAQIPPWVGVHHNKQNQRSGIGRFSLRNFCKMKQAYVRSVPAKTLVQPSQNVHRKTKLCDTTEERKTCEEERERQQEESSVEERKEASVKPRFIQLRKKRPAHTPSNSLEISKKAKMAVAVQVPSQMNQAYVSPATAEVLAKYSQNICPKPSSGLEIIFHQSELFKRKRKTCNKKHIDQQVAACEEEERNICEEKREKQQEEHQRQEERHGEEVTKERGCPKRKGPGGEEAVKEEGRCLRRRGQHGDKEVKAGRGCPKRKGPGGEEAVKEEGRCLRRRGQHGDKEVKAGRLCPKRKGPGEEEAVKEEGRSPSPVPCPAVVASFVVFSLPVF